MAITDPIDIVVPITHETVAPVTAWTITPSISSTGDITLGITMMTSRGPRVLSVVAGDPGLDAEIGKLAPGLTAHGALSAILVAIGNWATPKLPDLIAAVPK